MSRTPAVANMFYPGDQKQLQEQLKAFVKPNATPKRVLAAISPHAGYMYSGEVAGAVFSRIEIPKTVVILGPNHRGLGKRIAVGASGSWDMPMGAVPINKPLASLITDREEAVLENDDQAHAMEHSIEVQIPFLQALRPDVTIVPISVSHIPFDECKRVGLALAEAVKAYGQEVLLLASTDMTHYESQEVANAKDQLAIDRILGLDPKGLYSVVSKNKITMCGVVPTTIVLGACSALGATEAELVKYATSGDVTGDFSQVVGYAGFIVY